MRNKADTRAAAVVETLKTSANIFSSGEEGKGSPKKRKKRRGRAGGSGGSSANTSQKGLDRGDHTGPEGASASASASASTSLKVKPAPFWETFLFGAQTPEFDIAAQAQLRRMATPEKEGLLSPPLSDPLSEALSPEEWEVRRAGLGRKQQQEGKSAGTGGGTGGGGGGGRGGGGRGGRGLGGGLGLQVGGGGATTYNPLLQQAQAQTPMTPLTPRRASLADTEEVTVKVGGVGLAFLGLE